MLTHPQLQAIKGDVTVKIRLSDPGRGSMLPPQLQFDATNWDAPQSLALELADAAFQNASSSPLSVNFLLDSPGLPLHGQQPMAWVAADPSPLPPAPPGPWGHLGRFRLPLLPRRTLMGVMSPYNHVCTLYASKSSGPLLQICGR